MIKASLVVSLLCLCFNIQAQTRWFNFGELDSLRRVEERPVLVFLEADWCTYCKKMRREAFSKADIQQLISKNFWPILLDIEEERDFQFNGRLYGNSTDKKYHELSYLFAANEGEPITPTLVIFRNDLYFQVFIQKYLSRKELKVLLSKAY